MSNMPDERIRDILGLGVEEVKEELSNMHKLELTGKRGRPKKPKGYHRWAQKKTIQMDFSRQILDNIDDFCEDHCLTRTAFIRLSVFKMCKELGIGEEYITDYDKECEQRMAESTSEDSGPRNPYGSPWTTDPGNSSQSD